MIDYIAVGKWVQRFVKNAGFDELSFEMEQTMVNEVMQAALGDNTYYRLNWEGQWPVPQPIRQHIADGIWVQVWPKVKS